MILYALSTYFLKPILQVITIFHFTPSIKPHTIVIGSNRLFKECIVQMKLFSELVKAKFDRIPVIHLIIVTLLL